MRCDNIKLWNITSIIVRENGVIVLPFVFYTFDKFKLSSTHFDQVRIECLYRTMNRLTVENWREQNPYIRRKYYESKNGSKPDGAPNAILERNVCR